MRQVEVDDEVFAFVKAKAEPLIDTFNSTLRRLLPLADAGSHEIETAEKSSSLSPALPAGVPEALKQILETVSLVRGGAYTRTAATQFVAKRHNVSQQTVHDKYGRQLQLTASQFDRLLEQDDLKDLRKLLCARFPEHIELVDSILRRRADK